MAGIYAQDLIRLEIPDLPVWVQFDKEVATLNATGIGYLEIGRVLNASPNLVKDSLRRQGLERNRIKKEYCPRKKAV